MGEISLSNDTARPCSGLSKLSAVIVLGLCSFFASACASSPRDTSQLERDPQTHRIRDGHCFGLDCRGMQHEFQVPVDSYYHYQSLRRTSRWVFHALNPGRFVTPEDATIVEIACTLTRGANTPEQKAAHLLKWVCGFPYDYKEAKFLRDYARFPVETIMERIGDCEDTSYLYASLCKAVGLDVAVLIYPDHVTVAVAGDFKGDYVVLNGRRFYMAETQLPEHEASIGSSFGYHPKNALLIHRL